jgi:bacillithiol biosynthesis cysteine-adding enzyme BshC
MDCISTRLPYRQTGAFQKTPLDYIDQSENLKSFFSHPPNLTGIQKAIEDRKKFPTERAILKQVLEKQYETVSLSGEVKKNIDSLLSPDTFTITTAHQNNIFTGPLYFIYKILHAIRLSEHLKESFPGLHFVPVYYMGSEDADLEELNHIYLEGDKLVWDTKQKGAVGRMKVDQELLKLIDKMEGQLLVQPFGHEMVSILKTCYRTGEDIQTATFRFVHTLFQSYGLVIVMPDQSVLKKQSVGIFENELLHQTASSIVDETANKLEAAGYKVQVNPREINLFYLIDDIRERIVEKDGRYFTFNGQYSFNREELLKELHAYPERFSPNVILRGLYQETILPNIAFIGGGGETTYWLQLKGLFDHYKVPFPVLVLRNSFLLVEKKWQEKISKLGFSTEDFFLPEQDLLNKLVLRESKHDTRLNGSLSELEQLYESFKAQAIAVDSTLEKHVDALKLKSVHSLRELQKKMLRAEKRKFTDHQRQIHSIKERLFPNNGLQERYENMASFYSKWGPAFIHTLYMHSLSLEQEFVILSNM